MLTHAAFHFWINTSEAFFLTVIYVIVSKIDGLLELLLKTLSYGDLGKYPLHTSVIFLCETVYSYCRIISQTRICVMLISKQEYFFKLLLWKISNTQK